MLDQVLLKIRREAGLSVILTLQATIIFVIAPLAGTGYLTPVAIEAFRFGLAAAAVLMLTRSGLGALVIAATFVASVILSFSLHAGGAETAIYVCAWPRHPPLT